MATVGDFIQEKVQEYSELIDDLYAQGTADSIESAYNIALGEIMLNIYKWEEIKREIERHKEFNLSR